MAKKRKSDTTRLDEVDRNIYTTFCSAANSLSQLYTQAMNQQKLSFQAGERNALEKLYQWISRQEEQGSRVTTVDVVTYLQNEIEYAAGEEPSMSPRQPLQHQHAQSVQHASHFHAPIPSNPFATATDCQVTRSLAQPDQQAKNSVFSSALSSPVRRSLQPYHIAQGGNSNNTMSSGNLPHTQSRDTNSPSSSDCMDMHADSPSQDFPY